MTGDGEPLPRLTRGLAEIDALLESDPGRVSRLEGGRFQAWVEARVAEASHDPVFQQRCVIRDLSRAHHATLGPANDEVKEAEAAYRSSSHVSAVERAERELQQRLRAVEGLTKAVEEGRAQAAKRDAYAGEAERARERLAAAIQASPEYQRWVAAQRALEALEVRLGLHEAREELALRNRRKGRAGSSQGSRFEHLTGRLIEANLRAELESVEGQSVHCVSGATLQCARGEFDHLLVVDGPQELVEVVAMVEVKRNPNDLAHGFLLRQENLAWFIDDASGFDLAAYRNDHFVTGRFDRPVTHIQEGRAFHFGPASFRRFQRDPQCGDILKGLWFITEARPLLGVSARELQQVLFRVSADPALDLAQPGSFALLRDWMERRVRPLQAADVLRRYRRPDVAGQLLFTRH